MTTVDRTIVVRSDREFGHRPPPGPSGELLRGLEGAARDATLMAFRGRSGASGRPPTWLQAATDIRFRGISGDGATNFHFEAPRLGDAAAELYEQREFWSQKPDPEWTALDLLGPVVSEISRRNEESDRFDGPLLSRVYAFGRAIRAGFDEIYPPAGSGQAECPISAQTVEAAKVLRLETPLSRQVRIVGSLDMLRASTQGLALRLDTGEEVRGVLSDSVRSLTAYLERRVVLFGQAVFRPSGRLLRVDVDSWEPGESEPSFFSRVPQPLSSPARRKALLKPQGPRTGVAAFFGRWPGEETDEELLAALRALP